MNSASCDVYRSFYTLSLYLIHNRQGKIRLVVLSAKFFLISYKVASNTFAIIRASTMICFFLKLFS